MRNRRWSFADSGALTPGQIYRVTASALALRQGPSTSEALIEWMPTGTLVSVIDPGSNQFAHVKNEATGKTGYAAEQYLSDLGTPQPGPALPAGTFYVAAGPPTNAVNIRPTPSIVIAPIGGLSDGTAVHTTGVNLNGFAKIDLPQPGWIASQYLSDSPRGGVIIGGGPANVPTSIPTIIPPGGLGNVPPPPPPPTVIEPTTPTTPTTTRKAAAAGGATAFLLIALGIGFIVARDKKKRKAA